MRHFSNTRRGLTLLELLIVVLIMAAIAGAAVSLTDNLDSQTRYDETTTKLNLINYAIVGDSRPQPDGRRLLSGFVVDMGRLPRSIDELVSPAPLSTLNMTTISGVATRPFDLVTPLFDPTTDANGLNDNSGDTIAPTNIQLTKGWRGPYLRSISSHFRDGWGTHNNNTTDDVLFHGWRYMLAPLNPALLPLPSESLRVYSVGSDGNDDLTVSPVDTFAHDAALNLLDNTWTAPASVLSLEVTNNSGASKNIGVSLLVYYDDWQSSQPRWRRYDSDGTPLTPVPMADDASHPFIFPNTTRIPLGQHLLVVYDLGSSPPILATRKVDVLDGQTTSSSTSGTLTIGPPLNPVPEPEE